METLVAVSADTVAKVLGLLVVAALVVLLVRGIYTPLLVRIGLRNAVRRPLRTTLIIFGLMLATTFVSTALIIDDTVNLAITNVAVFSLGRVDEEVVGGSGSLGLFPQSYGDMLGQQLQQDPHVAGVAPGFAVPNLLIVDDATGQVRGDIYGVAVDPTYAGPLADLQAVGGSQKPKVADLAPDELYLNRQSGDFLRAQPGDTLSLYSARWPGQRFRFRLRGLVSGGPLAERPSVLLPLSSVQVRLGAPRAINRIYIANRGGGLGGVQFSDAIVAHAKQVLPAGFQVHRIKLAGVNLALQTQEVFSRILGLYTLFALSIGLLLIFLIFALLAAERRVELGMTRAVGMRRTQVVWVLLFEGAAYEIAASIPGILTGIGLSVLIMAAVSPSVARLGLPLRLDIEPRSLAIAACIGLLFTLTMLVLASWAVSRVTIAAALRNLPEPPAPQPSMLRLARAAFAAAASGHMGATTTAWARLVWGTIERGWLPLPLSVLLVQWAISEHNALVFAVGVAGVLAGSVLVLRWLVIAGAWVWIRVTRPKDPARDAARVALVANRLSALVVGVGLVLYWALPLDIGAALGVPRFDGGMEVFFGAGVLMVFGAVLAVAPNLGVLISPLQRAVKGLGRLRHVNYVALVYPAHQRVRAGIGLSMFSLVCFTMVVMACIAASTTQRYGDFAAQSGGYDIIGQPLFKQAGGVDNVRGVIQRNAPLAAQDIAAISAATPLPVVAVQPGASEARWGVYPAAALQGAFLEGQGLPLAARAQGYASDAAVWNAVREQPGAVVIDAGALSRHDASALGIQRPAPVGIEDFVAPPIASSLLGFSNLEALLGRTAALEAQNQVPGEVHDIISDPNKLQRYAFHLDGIVGASGAMTPTPIWIADPRGGAPLKVTVIGVVDNLHGQSYGLLGSSDTFAPIEAGLAPFAGEFYFFKLRPGSIPRDDALAIGSALLADGFQTTVIQDALEDVNGPRVFASRVLIGLVALTLLVGMAALGVTGMRAVVERRQQIGMLRALGYHRLHVRLLFMIESVVIAGGGVGLGLLLGLLLCYNIFAADFFVQFHSGFALVVPWPQLTVICGGAVAAAVVAALVPSIQASCIAPADALRYE
ncbi:MAG: ABC transporter permease [Ktedonobacterales bacterium]